MTVFAVTIQMITRSSHQRCSVRKGVLRNFRKIHRKTLGSPCSLSSESCRPRPCIFIQKEILHRCFPMNFAKFLRTPFLITPLNDCFSTIQQFLADNRSKVLNGQQQHKGVTFRWSRICPSLVKLF